jgi:AraC-like DNA-binding protein
MESVTEDWSRYWRSPDAPVEAMHAHFRHHVYHRHAHETYSLGVTDVGAQSFTCRGAARTSAAGMVMAFNPDDPHDGWAADGLPFTYRMVHIGPDLVADLLADAALRSGARPAGLPLFTEPVLTDPVLAASVRRLHHALTGGAPALRRDELLASTVRLAARLAAAGRGRALADADARPGPDRQPTRPLARRVRELIVARYLDDLTAADLAAATGCSRFAVHRAFTAAYGLTPSDYQRQLRLRAARRLIAAGTPIGEAAAQAGFADQAHLSRWFSRCYGITPGRYARAGPAR